MSRSLSGFQTWVKPLSVQPSPDISSSSSSSRSSANDAEGETKSYFVVLLNTNDAAPVDIPVVFDDYYRGDFAPASFSTVRIYDLWHDPPQLLGKFTKNYTARAVRPHASMALRMDVLTSTVESTVKSTVGSAVQAKTDGDDSVRGSASTAGPRDPLQQPFCSESIWNTPIGSAAVYIDAKITPFHNLGPDFSHFVETQTSDPSVEWYVPLRGIQRRIDSHYPRNHEPNYQAHYHDFGHCCHVLANP